MSALGIQNLDVPAIGDLLGKDIVFSVESYQRGYRWKKAQVIKLLDDIMKASSGKRPYMLQPIVLRKKEGLQAVGTTENRYELIDGQQRLTCIWIILQYLNHFLKSLGDQSECGNYIIDYTTRPASTEYLRVMSEGIIKAPSSIDEEHFANTYNWTKDYFEKKDLKSKIDWYDFLKKKVHVIWYEAEKSLQGRSAEDIFMSLNRGRIPLTDSELVKTLLLVRTMNRDQKTNESRNLETQAEIATQWDEMEHHLADEDFWAFLSGNDDREGRPRMDYLLAILPSPTGTEWEDEIDDDYKIFNRYSNLIDTFNPDQYKDPSGKPRYSNARIFVYEEVWRRHIRASYLKLLNWADDTALYHKIGYLVAVTSKEEDRRKTILQELMKLDCPKWKIEEAVDKKIKALFEKIGSLDSLQYKPDHTIMENLLLLFNVITCMDEARKSGSRLCERYSFARHFDSIHPWSLEHINPQKEMRTLAGKARNDRGDWFKWLEKHAKYVDIVKGEVNDVIFESIKTDLHKAIVAGKDRLTEETFRNLYENLVGLFNAKFDEDSEDGLGNMALLRKDQNSSLGASVFVDKRKAITRFVSCGEFVPLCTRRVFLKYYIDDELGTAGHVGKFSFAFWTNDDAGSYVEEIRKCLRGRFIPRDA